MNDCDLQIRPMYRHEYEALGALGFFDDERVELLDGQVVLAAEEGMVVSPSGAYLQAHPTTASLVIEVANASRRVDLGFKAVLYAAAGIPEYWVVDLVRDEVVVHREPAVKTWKSIIRHREGVVTALHHPAVAVDVQALLR